MKFNHIAATLVFAGASVILVSCGGTESTAGDEAAIRDINKKWMELIAAKDAKTIAETVYAENGQLLPPNSPKAAGREALVQAWTGVTSIPGLQLTFETESLTFAKSGELAVEVGTYKMVMGEGAAQATDTGKTTSSRGSARMASGRSSPTCSRATPQHRPPRQQPPPQPTRPQPLSKALHLPLKAQPHRQRPLRRRRTDTVRRSKRPVRSAERAGFIFQPPQAAALAASHRSAAFVRRQR
jgi:ketosteroid isomerase-like protein